MICCANCGEVLTAPIFIGGKPYGYTCASKVGGKKPSKTNENYVLAESHNFNANYPTQQITAVYNGRKYSGMVVETTKNGMIFYWSPAFEIDAESNKIYIRCSSFKSLSNY